jgi:peptidoglycan L-alanyl-D-glutamate endopeptidase CwlK
MSRSLDDLNPVVRSLAERHISLCKENDLDVIITQTLRTIEEQDALYEQGRSLPGKIVTKAKGGQSYHNFKLAYDIAIRVNGQIDWNNMELYKQAGELGVSLGLEWGGDFKKIKDNDHFQYTFGMSLADLQAGKVPPDSLETVST